MWYTPFEGHHRVESRNNQIGGSMRDVLVKNIPDGITDEQVFNFVGVLVERFHNAKVNEVPEVKAAVTTAQIGIDGYRKANLLTPKFEKVEPVEEKVEE